MPVISEDKIDENYLLTLEDDLTLLESLEYELALLNARRDVNAFMEFVIRDRITKDYIKQSKVHINFQNAIDRYRLLIFGMPREHGKCLAEGTLIQLSNGLKIPIEQINKKTLLPSMDSNYKIKNEYGLPVNKNGIKPVYRLTTLTGREIEATANHKFYVYDEWRELKDLKIGNRIAVSRKYNLKGKQLKDLIPTSDILWDEIVSIEYAGRKMTYDLEVPATHNFIANDIVTHNTTNIIGRTLKEIGDNPNICIKIVSADDALAGKRVTTIKNYIEFDKRFQAVYPMIQPYRGNWGKTSFNVVRDIIEPNPTLEGCLTGDTLIDMPCDRNKYPNGIPIKNLTGKKNFLVYSYSKKDKRIVCDKAKKVWKTGKDIVYEINYEWVTGKGKKQGSIKATANHLFMLRNGEYKRLDNLEAGDKLMPFGKYANPQIISIKKIGVRNVYDMEVENNHNFAANGIIVHNSGVLTTGAGDRADILILDDPVNLKNAIAQPAMRDIVYEAISNVWLNLLSPNGKVIWIGTPWHKDDAMHRMMENPAFKVIQIYVDDKFTPVFPEKWGKKELMARREMIKSRAFARGFQGKVLSDDERLFGMMDKYKDNTLSIEDVNDIEGLNIAGVDLAISEKDGNAYTVIFGMKIDDDGNKAPVNILRKRISSKATVAYLLALWKKYDYQIIVVEANVYQKAIIEWIDFFHATLKTYVEFDKNINKFVMKSSGMDSFYKTFLMDDIDMVDWQWMKPYLMHGALGMPYIKPFVTGRNKADETIGLPGFASDIRSGKWIIPSNGCDIDCDCNVCKWVKELEDYPNTRYKDVLMASWFANSALDEIGMSIKEV